MKKRDLLILLFAGLLCISFLIPPAWAGSKQRHRWEGVAIGAGAVIMGGFLFNHPQKPYFHHKPSSVTAPAGLYSPHNSLRNLGHWKVTEVWVPPIYKRAWNPGHYNRHGVWVPEQWIEIVIRPGYWNQSRVWVNQW